MNEEAKKYIEDLREKFERECNGPGDLKRRQELLTTARHAIMISDEDFTKVEMEHAAFKTMGSFEFGFYVGARWADEHQKSPWISVKERLPDYEQDCVLSYENAFIEIGGRYTKESGVPYLDENGFVMKRNGGRYTGDVVHVDYWMPIPELPKGGRQ